MKLKSKVQETMWSDFGSYPLWDILHGPEDHAGPMA
jgi:hypothetical protein